MAEGGGDGPPRRPRRRDDEVPDAYDQRLLQEEIAQVEDRSPLPAHTPRLTCMAEVQPDTVDNVQSQATHVLSQFIYDRFTHDQERHRIPDGTPSAPELTNTLPPCYSPEQQVGRQLANIGDDIQRRYSRQFSQMLKVLNVQDASPYDSFRAVAIRLFSDGNINWGRVVALFCFGYRIAVDRLTHGSGSMIRDIIKWIIEFMFREKISSWIAEHGGWGAVLRLVEDSITPGTLALILGTAVIAVFATLFFTRKSS